MTLQEAVSGYLIKPIRGLRRIDLLFGKAGQIESVVVSHILLCVHDVILVSDSFIILEVLLWIIAPVECKNKPFIGNQKKRCQTYSKVIILLLGALFMAFLFMKMSEYLLEIWLILVYFSATILIELHKKLKI